MSRGLLFESPRRTQPGGGVQPRVAWLSAAGARPYFANKNWTDDGLAKALFEEYDLIAEIVRIALEKNIAIRQPFAGTMIGPFQVLSPSQRVYELFLPQFDRTPDPDQAAAHFAFLVLGRALDKSLFCGDQPFTTEELAAQADAGASAFLAAYAAM